MKEIRTIINAYKEIDFNKTKAALVTVVGLEGSSYRRRGARMLVLDNGIYLGGISGGCLEGDALKRAQIAILKNAPSIVRYDTTQDDDHQIGVGLGCNGIIDILFTPLDSNDKNNPVNQLSSISTTRVPRILVSITNTDNDLLGKNYLFENETAFLQDFPDKDLAYLVLKDIHFCLQTLVSQTITYSLKQKPVTIFIEVLLPEISLIIFGNNNDIYAMSALAKELGWKIIVINNIIKANKKIFQLADQVLDFNNYDLDFVDSFSAIVLMTHDYNSDLKHFPKIVGSNANYIGLLGPRNRAERLFKEAGIVKEFIEDRVYAPAGLDIGATTPEEIALSIIAEIKAKFAGRTGGHLKFRKGTINSN